MPRYSLETQEAQQSIQQETLGTSKNGSSDTKSINAVNTNYAYLVSSGGVKKPGVNIQDSTTLFLRWRHSQNHFYRTTYSIEFYGGRDMNKSSQLNSGNVVTMVLTDSSGRVPEGNAFKHKSS